MCLHIDLKYDRTEIIECIHDDGNYFEEIKIYKCEICKKEFEVSSCE